jgi:hypothetical protein
MERGIALNLFEVYIPEIKFPVFSMPMEEKVSLDNYRRQALPALVYGSNELKKIIAYGLTQEETLLGAGFVKDEIDLKSDPRFVGRLIIEAISYYFANELKFEMQHRLHNAIIYELADVQHPIKRIEERLEVFPSFKLQSIFLNIASNLHYFLMVSPRTRYHFVHKLLAIQNSVDCTGRFVKINCPSECDIYDCRLYDLRGMLAGKFTALNEESSFHCRFSGSESKNTKFVVLDDRARIDYPIPIEVCELEASISNINAIFSQRFNPNKASNIIGDLRVASGDLLPTSPRRAINTEVGQRRWRDIQGLLDRLPERIFLFGNKSFSIMIDKEPLHSIEGGFTPEDLYMDEIDKGLEEIEDEAGDNSF